MEMIKAGITTVGEFHYVHHSFDTIFDLDMAVVEAAIKAGIRLVLIQTFYSRAGFNNAELLPEQKKFGSDVNSFIKNIQELIIKTKDYWPQVTIATAGIIYR